MDFSNYSSTDQPNYFSELRRDNKGIKLKKSKNFCPRGTSTGKYRNRTIFGNHRGAQHRFLHLGKAPSKIVSKALQHRYYSTLFEGDKDLQTSFEEHDRSGESNSLPEPLFGTRSYSPERQREKANTQPPTQSS